MSKSPFHAMLFGGLVTVLAACSALTNGGQDELSEAPVVRAETGEACGGLAGIACLNTADYCHFDADAQCGAADQMGECRVTPQACTREYRPVCGCDGESYPNPCVAHAAGTSVASFGACGVQPSR